MNQEQLVEKVMGWSGRSRQEAQQAVETATRVLRSTGASDVVVASYLPKWLELTSRSCNLIAQSTAILKQLHDASPHETPLDPELEASASRIRNALASAVGGEPATSKYDAPRVALLLNAILDAAEHGGMSSERSQAIGKEIFECYSTLTDSFSTCLVETANNILRTPMQR